MDIRDVLNPAKAKFPFTGSYYRETFDHPDTGRKRFRYKFENPYSRAYKMLFANVQDFTGGNTAIRTNAQADYKAGETVVLQDGKAYAIADAAKDYNTAPQEAFRLGNANAGIEYVLRLVEIDNPWELK